MSRAAQNFVMRHSNPKTELLPLSEVELCQFIRMRTGIVIADYQLRTLRDTVHSCCQHFSYKTAAEFVRVLKHTGAEESPELEHLIRGITVGESYFFRDDAQCSLLKHELLPAIIDRKRRADDKMIRIWSAGCAGGQELHSVAIYLAGLLPDIDQWNIHLLGTDINTDVLREAISGKYTKWSLRAMHADDIKKYFTVRDEIYTLRSALRKMTKFAYLNLFSDSFPSILTETTTLDLILCRNVFIYFDTASTNAVMDKFTECLNPGGVIILGASDHYSDINDNLLQNQDNRVFYYQRKQWRGETVVNKPVTVLEQPVQKPVYQPPVPLPVHEERVAEKSAKPGKAKPASAHGEDLVPADAESLRYGTQDRKFHHVVDEIIELIKIERWRDVASIVSEALARLGDNDVLFQLGAKALANLGELDAARSYCERSLAINATAQHTYLLYAIVLIELDDNVEAEKVLRKALFLDRTLVEAHYHMGILSFRMGQNKKGIRNLRNALAITEKGDPDRKIHNAQDMTYARFAEILRNEIDMYESHHAKGQR